MPVALAPTGLCGMQHGDGEILATRVAEAFGVPFCLSTMSICSIEDVEANATKPFWFQLYVMRNRGFVERLIGRAKQALCSALVVTLYLPIAGQRHKVSRNGISVPLTIANLIDLPGDELTGGAHSLLAAALRLATRPCLAFGKSGLFGPSLDLEIIAQREAEEK